jgi:serine-type D-Ala-D-Ala carboxypeptidase/endopeptidase (penicillin-binding protein 4)
MKAINTAAALEILGKDFRFTTKLQYDGYIEHDSILNGNIYITGGGDPTLGSPRLDSLNDIQFICKRWTDEVRKLGIKHINGAIIADASIYDDSLVHSSWVYEDLGRYYGAGACGLNFHENYFQVFFKAGAKYGDFVKILDTVPFFDRIKIINNIRTGGTATPYKVFAYGSPYDNERLLKGVTPRNKDEQFERTSIPDPAYFCSCSFSKNLCDNGITVRDTATSVRQLIILKKPVNNIRITFYIQESPKLDSIVKLTNLGSVNTYAEAIVKMSGFKAKNSGSFYAGTQAVTEFWKSKGVDLKGFVMKDGSGLSTLDRVSTRQLASIMRAYITDSMYPYFIKSLPVAGKTGSISNIFKNTVAENNLIAKSGYMRQLRSYTGYVTNKSGKLLTFAIIVNNHLDSAATMKAKLEKIMVLIAETY